MPGEALSAVRAVSVVIPTTDHAAIARQAFARGVDVLLEKPLTRTVEEANELIALAERAGRILQVGHLERFNPGVVAARAVTTRPMFSRFIAWASSALAAWTWTWFLI